MNKIHQLNKKWVYIYLLNLYLYSLSIEYRLNYICEQCIYLYKYVCKHSLNFKMGTTYFMNKFKINKLLYYISYKCRK